MDKIFRHYSCPVDEEKRNAIDDWSWGSGFTNLYFEELPDGQIWLHVYTDDDAPIPEYLAKFELLDSGTTTPEDWFRKWREMLHPFELSDGVLIIPLENEQERVLDPSRIGIVPGMAFGTGLHETTRLCARKLADFLKKDQSVLDVGCGTGILSVMAKKAGAGRVVALDLDEQALKKSRETFEINGVEVDLRESNFLSALKNNEIFDIIVSNMIVELLEQFCGLLKDHMNEDSILILSGISDLKFAGFKKQVSEEFRIMEEEGENEWRSLVLKKK